jgi:hypothetical protein
MTDREALLDEIARCFARAAVDAFIAANTSISGPVNGSARDAANISGALFIINDKDHHHHERPPQPSNQ